MLEALRVGGSDRDRYSVSAGREWKPMSPIASGAIQLEFPLDLRLSTRFSHEFRDFANSSTFPDRRVIDQQDSV